VGVAPARRARRRASITIHTIPERFAFLIPEARISRDAPQMEIERADVSGRARHLDLGRMAISERGAGPARPRGLQSITT